MRLGSNIHSIEHGNYLEHEVGFTDLKRVVEIVKQRHNLDLSNYAKSSLLRRVKRIISLYNVKSFDDLYQTLTARPDLMESFVEEITVNTTEMFRDPSLWRMLKRKIVPDLNFANNLSVWHAGCSSGEEVLSFSLLLQEMGLLGKIRVVATDINNSIIDEAKKGRVQLRRISTYQENYKRYYGEDSLADYYTKQGDYAVFNPELIKHVDWRKHNLVDSIAFSKFDLIFCRNVLIYFNPILQNRVFELFHESLFNNGKVILGSKESMITSPMFNKFKEIDKEEKIYQKL